eukprot:6131200-Pleurochrysis_carterae.AAC.1
MTRKQIAFKTPLDPCFTSCRTDLKTSVVRKLKLNSHRIYSPQGIRTSSSLRTPFGRSSLKTTSSGRNEACSSAKRSTNGAPENMRTGTRAVCPRYRSPSDTFACFQGAVRPETAQLHRC